MVMLPAILGSGRIFLYGLPIDMRRSFDGLFAIVQTEFQKDVRLGDLFVFLNRRLDRVKLLWWDGDGMAILMKRLELGTYQRPTSVADDNKLVLDATQLTLLLTGIDLNTAKRRRRYELTDVQRAQLASRT